MVNCAISSNFSLHSPHNFCNISSDNLSNLRGLSESDSCMDRKSTATLNITDHDYFVPQKLVAKLTPLSNAKLCTVLKVSLKTNFFISLSICVYAVYLLFLICHSKYCIHTVILHKSELYKINDENIFSELSVRKKRTL